MNRGFMQTFEISFAGDEILGATINFDKLSKEEVLKVLKMMEPFNDKVQVVTRSNISKSLENLDVKSAKSPETVGGILITIPSKQINALVSATFSYSFMPL